MSFLVSKDPTIAAGDAVRASRVDTESATDGQVLTSDGAGNAAWESAGASAEQIANIEYNIGVNSLRDAVNGGYAYFNMVGGVGDVYTDETGIDTGAAVNQTYDAAGDFYSPLTNSTANLLLHCDGVDGSTSFIDATGNNTMTANGDAQIDTAQSQFGGASALFDGTGDFISTPSATGIELGAGDYTIDLWVRPTNVATRQAIVDKWDGSAGFLLDVIAGGGVRFLVNGGASSSFADTATGLLANNTWAHVAVTNSSGTVRIFINGTQRASFSGVSVGGDTQALQIGGGFSADFSGHIDEVRIVKGTADWTANFTAPTSAYSTGSVDMTLPSIDFTTNLSSVDYVRPVVLWEPVDASTLNTDFFLEVSRDSGTTWTAATLETDAVFTGSVVILVADEVDITGQPAGTTGTYRIRTANGKNIRVHGVYLQWR
jgi:hypothetical protein